MKRFFLIIVSFSMSLCDVFSQQVESQSILDQSLHTIKADSLSRTPSMAYFQKGYSLDRDYHYEVENRLKSLKIRKREIESIQTVVGFLSIYGVTLLLGDADNDWSLAWTIPASFTVIAGEWFLFSRWTKSIQKEIDIIQSSRMFSYTFNQNFEVGAVGFSTKRRQTQQALGVTLKVKW